MKLYGKWFLSILIVVTPVDDSKNVGTLEKYVKIPLQVDASNTVHADKIALEADILLKYLTREMIVSYLDKPFEIDDEVFIKNAGLIFEGQPDTINIEI